MPGIILEGGTFRPIFSAGVMDALLDEDTCKAVAAVFGEKYANTSVRELIKIAKRT